MRICTHLEAFSIVVKVVDHSNSGLPPWMSVCEDCAATIFEAMNERISRIAAKYPSGKSESAVSWARTRRLLWWLNQSRPSPNPAGVSK